MADDKDVSDEIARGVAKALEEQENKKKKQAQQNFIGCAVFVVGFPILIATCVVILDKPAGQRITRSEHGESWPFTVEEGYLDCLRGFDVVFRSGGTTYALNGAAQHSGYEPIDPIWRSDPIMVAEYRELGVEDSVLQRLKVNISPFIKRGLDLCE